MLNDSTYLFSLLENPVESDKTDYKAAEAFKEGMDFSNKLVKHILGFTNSGGGHIVIGFKEDANNRCLKLDEDLTDIIANSYEVTRLSSFVNSILGNQDRIDLTITKLNFKGKVVPIIYVSPFKKRPYFCKKDVKLTNGKMLLEDGGIYIRVPGAQTVKLAGVGDWDRLINQCLEVEYETFIKRARDVMRSENSKKILKNVSRETSKKKMSHNFIKAKNRFFK